MYKVAEFTVQKSTAGAIKLMERQLDKSFKDCKRPDPLAYAIESIAAALNAGDQLVIEIWRTQHA